MSITKDDFWATLNTLGAAQVRSNLATNVYLGPERALVLEWIERNNEASKAEQLLLARRASADAHNAKKIAILALIIAIISLLATFIGIFHKP